MTITLTLAQLEALNPCDFEGRKALYGRKRSLSAVQALEAGASISDLLWVAGRLGRKDLCVRFALLCAQRVAHLNSDPRVQAAIDAGFAWLNSPMGAAARAAWAAVGATDAAMGAAGAAEQKAQRQIFLEVFKED
jgi:hypothetical protein